MLHDPNEIVRSLASRICLGQDDVNRALEALSDPNPYVHYRALEKLSLLSIPIQYLAIEEQQDIVSQVAERLNDKDINIGGPIVPEYISPSNIAFHILVNLAMDCPNEMFVLIRNHCLAHESSSESNEHLLLLLLDIYAALSPAIKNLLVPDVPKSPGDLGVFGAAAPPVPTTAAHDPKAACANP